MPRRSMGEKNEWVGMPAIGLGMLWGGFVSIRGLGYGLFCEVLCCHYVIMLLFMSLLLLGVRRWIDFGSESNNL